MEVSSPTPPKLQRLRIMIQKIFKPLLLSCLISIPAYADFNFANFQSSFRQIGQVTAEATSPNGNTLLYVGAHGFSEKAPEPYLMLLAGNRSALDEAVGALQSQKKIKNSITRGITSYSIQLGTKIIAGPGDTLDKVMKLLARGKASRIKEKDAFVIDTAGPGLVAGRIYHIVVTAKVKVNLSPRDNRNLVRPVAHVYIGKDNNGSFFHTNINTSKVENSRIEDDDCMLWWAAHGGFIGEACGSAAASATSAYFPEEYYYENKKFKLGR